MVSCLLRVGPWLSDRVLHGPDVLDPEQLTRVFSRFSTGGQAKNENQGSYQGDGSIQSGFLMKSLTPERPSILVRRRGIITDPAPLIENDFPLTL